MKIILASTSPIRKTMLSQAGIEFEALPPICDEDSIKQQKKHLKLSDLALALAKAKAESISINQMDSYVIGSDQICEFDGVSISKSKNEQAAFDCLKLLQGKKHSQNNGTCVYFAGKCVFEFKDKAILKMKALSDTEIWEYIKKDNPIGCAGSYKYELNGKYLFEKIEGNEECIQGFGLTKVVEFLRKSAK
jgi:septum formation protein